ncbi:exo-alpha-sialidase [Paenibacillus sp. N3.4]|uniref:exo-alpha-sialidase n=1 Tax=Paenibacillus sp. N3.4 TaxID=2603222 RepID=UPI00165005C5|nr:exo-alpha-sialidase [Paenibacillus sp. N3.4]
MKKRNKLLLTLAVCCSLTISSIPAYAANSGILNVSDTVTSIFDPVKDNGDTGDHTHGSSIVELPNGELMCVWFQGNGERDGTTTRIMGARSTDGGKTWKTPFVLEDSPDIADINPVVYVDSGDRLWLFWYPVLAGRWSTSQPRYAYAEKGSYEYDRIGNNNPNWTFSENIGIKIGKNIGGVVDPDSKDDYISQDFNNPARAPLNSEGFVNTLKAKLAEQKVYAFKPIDQGGAGVSSKIHGAEFDGLVSQVMQLSGGDPTKYLFTPTVADSIFNARSGYPLARRLGWQTKDKPFAVQLGGGKVRLLLPLYSDTLETSIMAFTEYDPSKRLEDNSIRWEMSEPLVGIANVQPSMAQRKDGTIVAYMRDNGSRPYRVLSSESKDGGLTWSIAKDVPELQDPGVGHDLLQLKNGDWAFAHVDTESNRNTLAVAISDNEGKTRKYRRHLVVDTRANVGSYHYPAISEAKNGDILVSFSRFYSADDKNASNQSMANYKHIVFSRLTEDWVKQGDSTKVVREYEVIDREIAVPASFNIATASDSAIKALFPSTIKAYLTYQQGANNATLPSVDLPVNWDVSTIKSNFQLNTLLINKIRGSIDETRLPADITTAMLPAFNPPLLVYLYNDPAAIAATKVELDSKSLTLAPGQSSLLKATVSPSNTSNKTVIWSTSNESIAKVNNGQVTGVSTGSAIITATTLDGGFVATASVEVKSSGSSETSTIVIPDNNPAGTTKPDQQPATTPKQGENPVFVDVTDNYLWARNAINKLAGMGVIQGTSDHTFSPEKNISRADIMTMIVRALNLKSTFDSNFEDVTKDDYYYETIGVAKALGIVNGMDGNKFSPTEEISRQDLMVLVYRALKSQGKLQAVGTVDDLKSFEDMSNISDYAVDSVAALVKAGIIEGSDNMINPKGKATRAEVAMIVYRILNQLK